MPIVAPGSAGAAPLPVTTPIGVPDSESPTITTGRRMGELAAKAGAEVPPPTGKKRLPPAALGVAALVAVVAVAGGVYIARKGGSSDGKADAPPPVETGSAAPSSSVASVAAPSTAGPAVAVVETPTVAAPAASASIPAATAAPKKTRTKPAAGTDSAAPSSPAASAAKAPAIAAKTAVKPADLTVTIRRFLKINVSPSQARLFLDGNYIGISDDWDDAGGGALLTFNLEGQHRIRICYPEHRDLLVDVVVRATAPDDKVTIEQELPKGTPDGPTGPEGSFHRPNYKTVGAVLFNVDPPDAIVSVNGKEYGPASKWAKDEMMFRDMAVYQIGLAAPGREPKTVRLMVAPTAGEIRATIREKLKKQ
jgi:hypothetical protein